MHAAVDVTFKFYATLVVFGVCAQAESLKAAAVGQKAAGKFRKSVQSAEARHHPRARAQIHVIGVGKDDLRAQELHYIRSIERLDRAHGADRHKNGCADRAMRRADRASARRAVLGVYLKIHLDPLNLASCAYSTRNFKKRL